MKKIIFPLTFAILFINSPLLINSQPLAAPTLHDPNYTVELVASGQAVVGVTVGPTGDIFFTDNLGGNIFKVDKDTYTVETYASGFSYTNDLTFDSLGNLFVLSGSGNPRDIYKVFPDGSSSLFSTDYSYTVGMTADTHGNLFLGNSGDGTISKVYPSGSSETFLSGYGGPHGPFGVDIDDEENLYFVQHGTGEVYQSTPDKSVSLLGTLSPFGATFVIVDSAGVVYVSDVLDASIYTIHDGDITLFASGFKGKSSPPYGPSGMVFDDSGNLFVGDGEYLWKIVYKTPKII